MVGVPFLGHWGPLVIAHRGGGDGRWPENSRSAIEGSVRAGVQCIESDVRVSADGVVLLSHDATADRTTDGHGPWSQLTWAQVKRLRDRAGNRPLALREVLHDYPNLALNLDAKDWQVLRPLVRTLRSQAAVDRVCLASFSTARLRWLRKRLGPNAATSMGPAEVAGLWLGRHRDSARASGKAARPGPIAVQVPEYMRGVRVVDRAFVHHAHQRGLSVQVWTVNEPARMRALWAMGVDAVMTDFPTAARTILAEYFRPTMP